MKTVFKCYLQTLSPIHLGCDEVYEPMGFVIDEQRQQMVVFDPMAFIARMPASDRERFSAICRRGTIESILEIYKFMKGRPAEGRPIDVCPGLVEHYKQTIGLSTSNQRRVQNELNRFTIARTAFRQSDQRPFIPGSAVKGALRTAYLNGLAKQKKVGQLKGKTAAKDLEKRLMEGTFESDPFRMVKVSDFMPVGDIGLKVVYAINEKKRPSEHEAKGPYQILEVIQPGAIFTGEISVDAPEKKAPIKSPVTMDALLKSAQAFYANECAREAHELNNIQLAGVTPNGQMLRLGRHSGAESVTIEGHRDIRIMMGRGQKPKFLDHATTFWLSSDYPRPNDKNGLQPFGWTALLERAADRQSEFDQKEAEWKERQAAAQRDKAPLTSPPPEQAKPKPAPPESPREKLIKQLDLIDITDMGRLGTVIQNIETKLESDADKAAVAKAIKEKLGKKKFKKHKRKDDLQNWIAKGEQ